jgi:ABC transport system ATP-binding/permease protein
MMSVVNLENISLSLGGPPVLDGVNLLVQKGERICLLGRNGEGKTTMLRLIGGEIQADSGKLVIAKGTRVAWLPQEVPVDLQGTVREIVRGGVPNPEEDESMQSAERAISRIDLDPDTDVSTMSSGQKRRVLLARALACDPDLLLLDEPTNHMDTATIAWLEGFLGRFQGTLIFVTHDRTFLRAMANRIIELSRGRLMDWTCDYDTFLQRRDEALRDEAVHWQQFDRKLAQEEIWIRQGVRERRTRNEGRVRSLMAMRKERSARRDRLQSADLSLQDTETSGKLVIQAQGLGFKHGDQRIIRDFSARIMRGDKIGIIGANGTGKTTLIRLLLGDLQPDTGDLRHGTNLRVAYFDQLRAQLNPAQTVHENVNEGNETVEFNGRAVHVITYLQKFLFTPDRARSPISHLSGGERNRLLLAKLFTQPANLLVLDEPTNDLDLDTLELLEELLVEFSGTVLLVSHDRAFLDNVVTSCIAFEGDGVFKEYIGGYADWLRVTKSLAPRKPKKAKGAPKPRASQADAKPKLTYKENKELEALPPRIEALDAELASILEQMMDPDLYKTAGQMIADLRKKQESLESELKALYARWEELEARS